MEIATFESKQTRQFEVSIIIPNYNGELLLSENLPSVFEAIIQWGGNAEVIVVDDSSKDGSCTLIRDSFPSVKLIVNTENLGFSKTCNIGMAAASAPVLLCVNTDVRLEADSLGFIIRHFADDENLFAVSPRIFVEREGKNQGAVISAFRRGFIRGGFVLMTEDIKHRENLYAVGACAAYDASKFRALGGYGEIYSPFLAEDADICYRAWKRGWRSIYEPKATVWHYSNATIGKDKSKVAQNSIIYFRNRFILHWINLSDPLLVSRNILAILFRLSTSFLYFNFSYYRAFWGALHLWREILSIRRSELPYRKLSDSQILSRTRSK